MRRWVHLAGPPSWGRFPPTPSWWLATRSSQGTSTPSEDEATRSTEHTRVTFHHGRSQVGRGRHAVVTIKESDGREPSVRLGPAISGGARAPDRRICPAPRALPGRSQRVPGLVDPAA